MHSFNWRDHGHTTLTAGGKCTFRWNSHGFWVKKLQKKWLLQSATPRSNLCAKQQFCKVAASALECWCVGFIVIAAPPKLKTLPRESDTLATPMMVDNDEEEDKRSETESAKWASNRMAGIFAKLFTHNSWHNSWHISSCICWLSESAAVLKIQEYRPHSKICKKC